MSVLRALAAFALSCRGLGLVSSSSGLHKTSSGSEILRWLQLGGRSATAPRSLNGEVALLLAGSASRVAPIIQRWSGANFDLFDSAHVEHVRTAGMDIALLNNDVGADPRRTDSYNLSQRLVPPGGFIVDVGAHTGLVTIALAKLNPTAAVLAIEPAAENRFLAELNLALNGVSYRAGSMDSEQPDFLPENEYGMVTLVREGLGSVTETRPFFLHRGHAATSWIGGNGPSMDGRGTTTQYNVKTVLFTNLIQYNKANTDLVHLDCDGCEFEILADLYNSKQETRVLQRVGHIFGEYHPWAGGKLSEVTRRFSQGFMCAYGFEMRNLECKL